MVDALRGDTDQGSGDVHALHAALIHTRAATGGGSLYRCLRTLSTSDRAGNHWDCGLARVRLPGNLSTARHTYTYLHYPPPANRYHRDRAMVADQSIPQRRDRFD